ncbi:MAG: Holliday junction resolvase RuvX [Salibacteraceae bacterium]
MSRIVAIDFGVSRTGLAISDPLGIIANGLETVSTRDVMSVLQRIDGEMPFDQIVVGEPKRMSGEPSLVEGNIRHFMEALKQKFPSKQLHRFDERFTSKIAMQTMIDMGSSKRQRADKGNIDKISATLILQEFLNQKPA